MANNSRVRLTTTEPTRRPARVKKVEVKEKHREVRMAASSPIYAVMMFVGAGRRRQGYSDGSDPINSSLETKPSWLMPSRFSTFQKVIPKIRKSRKKDQ